jgi:hypothetical protein
MHIRIDSARRHVEDAQTRTVKHIALRQKSYVVGTKERRHLSTDSAGQSLVELLPEIAF